MYTTPNAAASVFNSPPPQGFPTAPRTAPPVQLNQPVRRRIPRPPTGTPPPSNAPSRRSNITRRTNNRPTPPPVPPPQPTNTFIQVPGARTFAGPLHGLPSKHGIVIPRVGGVMTIDVSKNEGEAFTGGSNIQPPLPMSQFAQ